MKIALPLEVIGLTLRLKHSTILYSGSVDLYVQFTFDEYWKDLPDKKAVFYAGDNIYYTSIKFNDFIYYCKIPPDVLLKPDHIRIGVAGADTISTNLLPIDVYQGVERNNDYTIIGVDVDDSNDDTFFARGDML
jgi:hypothetical protein